MGLARLTVLAILALALLAAPLAGEGQQAGKVYRVGVIAGNVPASEWAGGRPAQAFVQALRDLGYVEGRNLVFEVRSIEGRPERLSEAVAEILRLNVDVILSSSNLVTRAAKDATTSTPIVMVANVAPVEQGLVASLAHPGGNVTGLSFDIGPDLDGKRLDLLKQAVPHISRVAFVGTKYVWDLPPGKMVQATARTLGLTLFHAESTPPSDYAQAFATVTRERADALFAATSPTNFVHRRLIIDFAAKSRLPASYQAREFVQDGGLMAYGVNLVDMFRDAANYVGKILKGAKPGDLPVEQPTKFEFVINLKTAKALGLTIPPAVLARADEVIHP